MYTEVRAGACTGGRPTSQRVGTSRPRAVKGSRNVGCRPSRIGCLLSAKGLLHTHGCLLSAKGLLHEETRVWAAHYYLRAQAAAGGGALVLAAAEGGEPGGVPVALLALPAEAEPWWRGGGAGVGEGAPAVEKNWAPFAADGAIGQQPATGHTGGSASANASTNASASTSGSGGGGGGSSVFITYQLQPSHRVLFMEGPRADGRAVRGGGSASDGDRGGVGRLRWVRGCEAAHSRTCPVHTDRTVGAGG